MGNVVFQLKTKKTSKQRAEIFVWLNYLFIPLKGAMPVFFDNITKLINLIFFLKFR